MPRNRPYVTGRQRHREGMRIFKEPGTMAWQPAVVRPECLRAAPLASHHLIQQWAVRPLCQTVKVELVSPDAFSKRSKGEVRHCPSQILQNHFGDTVE